MRQGLPQRAKELCDTYGAGTAISVKVNVSDEQSVSDMIDTDRFDIWRIGYFCEQRRHCPRRQP